mgnify:CR=1 FL=1
MKHLVPAAGMLGFAGNAKAHDADMPALVHLAEPGRLVLTVIALAFIFLPLFRRRS